MSKSQYNTIPKKIGAFAQTASVNIRFTNNLNILFQAWLAILGNLLSWHVKALALQVLREGRDELLGLHILHGHNLPALLCQ